MTHIKLWREVLSFYDYVIGYGLHGCWPLLTNQHPYLAYEHGTIRQLPFLPDAQGRLCALTYRMADLSLITNADNNQAADTLGLYPYAFMPHPVNEWMPEIEQCRTLHEELLASLNADFIVFHPSRQHWDETRDPSLEKGNDIFIRGLARFIQECNPRGAAVFVDWGKMVNKTQRLLEELKIAQRVHWIPPQHNHAMVRYMKACDLLADQFYLGAFGSTMPKALLHETPAMLYLDEERHRWCFPEMPPVINASTPEEVFTGMRRLYEDKSYREALVRDGKSWYDRYHSNRVIAETFLRLFKTIPQPSRHGTLLT
ncbi:MAG: glycosyltransferase [Phycisphaerae bacterium]|nr:glycosyltransferase [Phycisphaerae bacterium]